MVSAFVKAGNSGYFLAALLIGGGLGSESLCVFLVQRRRFVTRCKADGGDVDVVVVVSQDSSVWVLAPMCNVT